MKALRTLTILFALALMCLPAPSAAAAEKPFKLDICAMPEHESFIFWYAKEQGWDKDEGLDFQIHFFQTGMDQLEALPAKQWVVGGTGTVPILVGALRYNTYLIGIANDESWVNAVTVRPDSPALKVKGWNPEYPNLLGSPETVKGKTFLYTQSSSQHFGMSEYLKALGLTEKDVVMQNMDPAQVLAAFDAGIGDFAGIWPMWLYIGMERGNKLIYQPGDVNAVLTLTLVGDKAFCDAHPDIVVKFLRVWLRGVNMIKKEIKNPKLAEQYHRFWTEWAGQDIEPQMAKMDLEYHPVFDIDQQLAIFDDSKGPSQVEQWQDKVLDFFASQGRFSPEEVKKIRGSGYINGTFLKMAAESIKELARRCSARLEWKNARRPGMPRPARGGRPSPPKREAIAAREPDVSRPCAGKGGSGCRTSEGIMSQYQQVKTHRQRALILLPLLSLSLFFLSWELIVDMGLVPQTLLASPSAVVELFFAKLANASPDGMLLQEHAWISIKEAFLGYFLALAVGIPLGLAMGWFRLAEGLARPIFEFIRPIPPIAWIPLTIYWFGIGLTGKVFIIWIGGIVPCVINSYVGVRMTNPVFLQMGRLYGATNWQLFWTVCIPSALPMVFGALQIALAWCWMNLVGAELLAANGGLGFLIQCGRKLGRPDLVVLGMVTVAMTGVFIGILIHYVEKKLLAGMRR